MAQTAEDRLNRAFAITSLRTDKFIVATIHPDCCLTGLRADGNTTRQINFAIENLFKGNAVICLDHHQQGTNVAANGMFLDRILRRLKAEHPGIIHPDNIEYNHLHSYVFLKQKA